MGAVKGGLALISATLLFACQPSPPTLPEAPKPRASALIAADVEALVAQLNRPEGVRQFLDPVAAAKANAFSWQPTGRSSNEIMFKLRDAKLPVADKNSFLARCLIALTSPDGKTVMENSPPPKGRRNLAAILTPASELLDELRYTEVAPRAAKLARRTINFYLSLDEKGAKFHSMDKPPTARQLAEFDQIRTELSSYAQHFLEM